MAEAALNALKKLEANKTCVNCDAYNKFGFQNICEKYKTFVCSNCKSAHQSYSQRVKSVSMSNWTMDEVDALREENGGGNAVARRVWLATWDEGKMRKPNEKDHVDYFKKFINKVYNEQAFYDESGFSSVQVAAPAASSSARSSQRAAQPAPAPVNLLDFGSPTAAGQPAQATSFDAFSGANWASGSGSSSTAGAANEWGQFASAPAPAPTAASNGGAFFADFSSAPAPTAAASTSSDGFGAFAAAPSTSSDGFGAFTAAPAPTPTAPAVFDPFAPTSGAAPVPSTSTPASFDPFAPSSSTATATASSSSWGMGGAQPAAVPPPARSGDFSAFDALLGPAHGHQAPMHKPYGHGMTGMHNMGMNPIAMGHGQMGGYGQLGGHGMNGHMMGGGNAFAQQPRPMMGGGNASVSISTYLDPRRPAQAGGGYPSGANAGARDPFAGLGLPQ